MSCFNYFEQLLCLVPQNPHLNMFFALFRSDWILPPPSDPSWWERRPWERRPRDEVAPPPPNRDRSRSPLREPMTPPGPPPPPPRLASSWSQNPSDPAGTVGTCAAHARKPVDGSLLKPVTVPFFKHLLLYTL